MKKLIGLLLCVVFLGVSGVSLVQASEKGKIVIGVTDKLTDLDPSNAYDFYTWEVLNNVMGGLMKYKPGTTELEPYLAESYEVKENNKVYIFHLRKDLKFADGTPCKAQDVVRSIKRVMTIKGDPSWLVTDFVKDVQALDDYTVKFILKKPVAYFVAIVATPPYFPVSPKYSPDKIEPDQTAGGVGPYVIKKWVRDQELILEKNPYFFEPAKNKQVVIRFYKNASTLRLALEKGDIDIAWRTLAPVDILSLKRSGKYEVIEAPGSFIRYMVMNVKLSPTDKKLVRQAIACIIDRNDIVRRVYMNTFAPLYSLVPQGMWSYEPVFKKYGDNNLALAQKLLKEAGYCRKNPLQVELWWTPTHYGSTEKDLAQVIKEQLENTGLVKVTLKSAEWSTYVDYLRKGAMMISLLGWYPDYMDPDNFLTPFLKAGANKWTGNKYSNPEVDNILEKASSIVDIKERTALYKKAQEILAEDVPYIPLVQGKLFIAARKGIKGIILGPTMLLSYSSIQN
ncbi:extracellular solute-binding protein family 5 [Thermodesulfatator indicus DSM 15286]|uniref:Extracellular solute-binding protein family 5 n=1 Tax=Thermodesulfatator indicus (strain DSM 15286 / JCM 11887 / CIR29812) TaxID=667014 RepID=F8ADI3_THEID|nr:ABC transporter substrate-binding protein [Thermodesulfatator indicus]AEH44857.1 extracellular solute-binding protein family 5 [Thermodesulfatator indicus DSM 15286]